MSNKKSNSAKSTSASTKSTSKKSIAKKAMKVARNFIDKGMYLVKLVDKNPRRDGTIGHKTFSIIKNGMTVEQVQEKGGRLKDIHWDLNKGYLKLASKKPVGKVAGHKETSKIA